MKKGEEGGQAGFGKELLVWNCIWKEPAFRVPRNQVSLEYLNGLVVFPTFFNLSLNLVIRSSWAKTVSSQSCFCWLYRASPSLAATNIINLILVLTGWWYPCIESSLVLLEKGVCYDQCVLLQNSISLSPASFCTPRPNLPVTPGVSWLPNFSFQSPIMKRTFLGGVSSKRSCRSL